MKHVELVQGLRQLHLHEVANQYSEISKISERESKTYEQFLAKIVEIELSAKRRLKVNRLIRDAKIPLKKSLAAFDFTVRTGITEIQVNRLMTGEFVKKGSNIVFFGSFGLGKSHLAMTLVEKLCENQFKCLYSSTHNLINQLIEAKNNLTLTALFKRLDKYDLIACDELGYVPHNQDGADLFFQLISQRAERKSMFFTTNLTFSEWDKVFINANTTAAAVDRIIHHCETFSIKGPSWRELEAQKNMARARHNTAQTTESETSCPQGATAP